MLPIKKLDQLNEILDKQFDSKPRNEIDFSDTIDTNTIN